ncbi:MAG: hypothetical protein PHW63_01100 [Alphaproteobacteria bacterium]|nr:hypothetical protein [Alphaproteobacteria bacterium]
MAMGGYSETLQREGMKSAGWYMLFDSLMSMDRPDLTEAIDYVKEDPSFDDRFRYDLEGLYHYRDFYGDRMGDFTPEEQARIEAYDEEWSLHLLDQLHKKQYGDPAGTVLAPEYDIS